MESGGHGPVREERRQSGNPAAVYTDREIEVTPVYLCESTGAMFAHEPYTTSR